MGGLRTLPQKPLWGPSLGLKSDFYSDHTLASSELSNHFALSVASALSSNTEPPERSSTGLQRAHQWGNLETASALLGEGLYSDLTFYYFFSLCAYVLQCVHV